METPISPAREPAEAATEPSEARRALLRRLYLPYAWLVFVPVLLITTVFWGTVAVLLSRISQRLAFHIGTVWSFCLCLVNFTWVRVRGRRNLARGQSYVIMSNHQSHFDILAFYGFFGHQFRWVMKQELRKVPGIGWGSAAVGHIFIDRSNREKAIASLNAARDRLVGGVSVMFFPEGTRSRDGRLQPFKKGGFVMAQDMGLPILPVTISGSRRVLPGHTLRLLPGRVTITIHPPISAAAVQTTPRDELMTRVREAIRSALDPWERVEAPPPPAD